VDVAGYAKQFEAHTLVSSSPTATTTCYRVREVRAMPQRRVQTKGGTESENTEGRDPTGSEFKKLVAALFVAATAPTR